MRRRQSAESRVAWTLRAAVTLLVLSAGVFARVLDAQEAAARPLGTVLFICEHGTVKSLLAKVLFEQYAREVGLPMRAISRGTNLEPVVPSWMQRGLAADRITLGAWQPLALRPDDLVSAAFVVSFDVPSTVSAGARSPRAQWDGLPSVSQNYAVGRDSIKARVHSLVDSLKRSQGSARH